MSVSPAPAITNAYVSGAEVVLLRRDPSGKLQEKRVPADYSLFLRSKDVTEPVRRALRGSRHVRSARFEGEHARVRFADEFSRRRAVEWLRDVARIEVLEGDVSPVRRLLADTGLRIAKPRLCYLDLETDSRLPFSRKEEMKILSWVVVDHETGEVFTDVLQGTFDMSEAEFLANERTLLEGLFARLEGYDQVASWNGDNFDFPVKEARLAAARVRTVRTTRRWLWLDQKALWERMQKNTADGDEKESLKLEDVAQSVLKEGKERAPQFVVDKFGDRPMGEMTWDLWAAGGEYRDALVQYMIKDAVLQRKLELKKGHIGLLNTVCDVCQALPDSWGMKPTEQVEGFMLRLGVEHGIRFATRVRYGKAPEEFDGAYVLKPIVDGVEKDVHVCDFTRLYPSIILSLNISPETLVEDAPINGPIPEGLCRAPKTGASFRAGADGILGIAVRAMIRLRLYWSEKMKDYPPGSPEWIDAYNRSMAYKVAVNSFYGVIGSPSSRFFVRKCAESVSTTGVWLIQHTRAEAEARGWKVIYIDTDSLFVKGCTLEEFSEFVKWCNKDLYPRLTAQLQCAENHIAIDYEKAFARLVMTKKKRYAARYAHYKFKTECPACHKAMDVRKGLTCEECGAVHETMPVSPKMEIKGLEFKRGDSGKMTRDLQEKFIKRLMLEEQDDPNAYEPEIVAAREHVMTAPLTAAEVKISKALSKPLRQYAVRKKNDGSDMADNAHVAVAKILEERGEEVGEGTKIDYFVLDASDPPAKNLPISDYAGEVDRVHLWQKVVWSPVERFLAAAFPHHDWDKFEAKYPRKPRKPKRGGAAPGQVALFDLGAPIAAPARPRVAP